MPLRHRRPPQPPLPPPTPPSPRKPARPRPPRDAAAVLALTAAALATRLVRLDQPAAVVFDELHFGAFLERHLRREFAFDIHPWLGKLTLAAFSYLAGFRADGFQYHVANVYPNRDYVLARIPSALFGSFAVPLMYLICRELRISEPTSLLAACLPLFDNLFLIESRLILLDAQLVFYLNLTLLFALRLWRLTASSYGSRRYYTTLVGTAVAGACAMSVKWTAAATPFLVALVCGLGVIFLRRPTPLHDCLLAAIIALAVYVLPWYAHLRLSTTSTPAATHMGDRFRQTLTGNDTFPYNPSHDVSFAESLYELHWRQFRANQKVKTRHHWESKWYEWPLNIRGIYYFVDRAPVYTPEHPVVRMVYLLQNPAGAIWVTASVATMLLLLPVVYRYRTMIPPDHTVMKVASHGLFLLCGYLLNLLPYMFVERCYFLYHYLPALTYGQLLVAVLIDALPTPMRLVVSGVVLFSVVAAFVFWSPWIYCLPIDYAGITKRQWMPRWN